MLSDSNLFLLDFPNLWKIKNPYWKLLAWNEQKRFHSSSCACWRSLFVLLPLLHACVSTITHTHKLSKDTARRSISDPIFLGKPNWKCKNTHDWTKNAVPFLSTYELESYIKWKYIFSSLVYNAKIFCITNQCFLSEIYTLRPH